MTACQAPTIILVMSTHTLDLADTVVPELESAIREVERTFTALRAARSKFNRCSKPANREAAREAMVQAEAAYREAATRRDELVEIRNARLTQRGDERGALWSRPEVDGPVAGELIVNGANLGPALKHADGRTEAGPHTRGRVKLTRTGGYDPKLGPKHPDNQDPTLPPVWPAIGDHVDYHSIIGGPVTQRDMVVRSGPQLMGGSWVVWLTDKAGCVAIEACTRVESPDKHHVERHHGAYATMYAARVADTLEERNGPAWNMDHVREAIRLAVLDGALAEFQTFKGAR